jgi:spore maturation protein CgeB
MNIAFFGSSILSAYWNGAATYYRGIVRALSLMGHSVTFYEPDAFDRQSYRDFEPQPGLGVIIYPNSREAVLKQVEAAGTADWLIKASGVGVFDDLLERVVLEMRPPGQIISFWDVDAPATLDRLRNDPKDPFARLIPAFDFVLTYGGGKPVCDAYIQWGAKACYPIYNGFDPETHYPVRPEERFVTDLSFLGNRLPDRESRADEFFFKPAAELPDKRFLLAGSGWENKPMTDNISYIGHLCCSEHNLFNSSALAILNVNRNSMAQYGFSPPTRIFEAAAAGACIISDYWVGMENFFEPGKEILVAKDGDEVAGILENLEPSRATAIGYAAYLRALSEHTYSTRAKTLQLILKSAFAK